MSNIFEPPWGSMEILLNILFLFVPFIPTYKSELNWKYLTILPFRELKNSISSEWEELKVVSIFLTLRVRWGTLASFLSMFLRSTNWTKNMLSNIIMQTCYKCSLNTPGHFSFTNNENLV